MNIELVAITEKNKYLLTQFISNMGNSVDTFRYFQKRDLNCLKNHVISYMLLEKQKPIAYGHLDKEGENIWLGICVIEAKTGHGLGNKMMTHLINFAQQNKICKIRLSVDKKNINAIKMYNKFGFYQNRVDENTVFMDLDIA